LEFLSVNPKKGIDIETLYGCILLRLLGLSESTTLKQDDLAV